MISISQAHAPYTTARRPSSRAPSCTSQTPSYTASWDTIAIGGLYDGPLFGKAWMRAAGMTEEESGRSNLPLIFAGTLVLEATAAVGLAAVIGADATVGDGAWTGLVLGLLTSSVR